MAENSMKERLGVEPTRSRLIVDCVELIDRQVKAKGGLSGIAIKGAYGTIKAIKKNFVAEVVNGLLDDWLDRLQPHYDTWASSASGTFAAFLTARSEDVAEDLLSVTDDRAQRTTHRTAKAAYTKMRSSAKVHVMDAVPELGRVVERHLGNA